jgi:hypothetical protein
MADEGLFAFGSRLERGDGGTPEEFTPIANVTDDIQLPSLERDDIESTVHKTTSNYRTFRGGLVDPGEVEITVKYHPLLHDYLVEDLEDCDPRRYRIVIVECEEDIAMWECDLILTAFPPELAMEDLAEATLTFKVSGKPVITSLES